MKKISKIMLCTLMALTITGCKDNPELENKNEAVVSFNEKTFNITANDLYDYLKEKYGTNYIIEEMDQKILDKEYPTDDNANQHVDNQVETYKMFYGGESGLLETLRNYGYNSLDEFKSNILLNYKRELATKDYIRKNITESEINKYYENKMFGDISASHILIKIDTNSDMTEEEKKEAETKANEKVEEVLSKLGEGQDFHELAQIYSEDTATASNGGRLESFNKGEMEASFENAAMNLKVNEYTKKAIKTSYGYHIIYKDSEKEKASLETVKETIIEKLIDEKLNDDTKLQYKALIELRESYGLVIHDEVLNNQYENAKNNWLYGKEE